MEDKYIKLSDAKNALADYIAEQTVSKYGSLESCMYAKFAATGAMNELDYVPAADVVPKSEVDEIVRQWKEEENCWQNNYITELRANEQIKAEVAREIFEELVRDVYSKIPDKILPVTFGEMSRHLDYNDGLNFGSRNAYFDTLKIIAELKKKYTEKLNG